MVENIREMCSLRSKVRKSSNAVYLNDILFPIVLFKNIHLIRISTLLFNFENRQVPTTHPVLRDKPKFRPVFQILHTDILIQTKFICLCATY